MRSFVTHRANIDSGWSMPARSGFGGLEGFILTGGGSKNRDCVVLTGSEVQRSGATVERASTCVCVLLLYSVQLGGQRSPLSTTYRAYLFIQHTANHIEESCWRHPEGKKKRIVETEEWESGLPLKVGGEWPVLHSLRR